MPVMTFWYWTAALLASAGMDGKAHIWNAWESPGSQMARCLSCHTQALKDIRWSLDGTSVLSCGFDQTARLSDVETGTQTRVSFWIFGEKNLIDWNQLIFWDLTLACPITFVIFVPYDSHPWICETGAGIFREPSCKRGHVPSVWTQFVHHGGLKGLC